MCQIHIFLSEELFSYWKKCRYEIRQLLVDAKRQAVKKLRFSVTQTRFVNFAWV